MLSQADNERITRTGPASPMGEALRRYWIPALLTNQLPRPDSDPLRLTLLGEQLIAFRDTNGNVGLIQNNCPHRGASLFFGRNEEAGLRCVYHGWKFDVAGQCVDMPNEPAESDFKHKVRATAYPCVEMGGVVWTYMGAPATMPVFQTQEWMRGPSDSSFVSLHWGDCNWVQLMEGGLDTVHSSFLHLNFSDRGANNTTGYRARSTTPKLEVTTTEWGYTYASIRHLREEHKRYVRLNHYVMPFHQLRSSGPMMGGHIWVPADDEHTWVYTWMHDPAGKPLSAEAVEAAERFAGRTEDFVIPGTRRFKKNLSNDYEIDRQMQRTVNYTGITGVSAQDMAVQETMGPISARWDEHLGTSDLAIIAARRLLLEASRDVEAGKPPRGSQLERIDARGAELVVDDDVDWSGPAEAQLVALW